MLQFLIGIRRRVTITMLWILGIWLIFEVYSPIFIDTVYSFLLPAKFQRCFPSDMMIKKTGVYPTLSIHVTSITMLLTLSFFPFLFLPLRVHGVHFGIEVFRWPMAVEAMQRGFN
jgi:hypothetical protein